MDIPLRDDQECLNTTEDDDAQSYMDEDDVREVRLHHWLSETAVGARLMEDSTLTRADSPLLGRDHPHSQIQESESGKPLPDLPTSLPRLRSCSTASSAAANAATPFAAPAVTPTTASPHRRSPSQSQISSHSQSPVPSRRPSLARQPSLPLLAESASVPRSPPPSARQSSRLHSISSSLSLGSNRNAVYIDSEEVSSRLGEWLTLGSPEPEREDDENLDPGEHYATSFERPQDSPSMTFAASYFQGPPPNTPMTMFYKTPYASSSQIYLGKGTGTVSGASVDETARNEDSRVHIPTVLSKRQPSQDLTASMDMIDQEDVRATPVPHPKLLGPDPSFSTSSSSSGSAEGSPMFSASTLSTAHTSSSTVPQVTSPRTLSSKPSLASLSMGVLSPKPSLTSIGLGYQNHVSSPTYLLSPPPVTASRWSLTSSVADDVEKDKKRKSPKAMGGTRKRLVSFISRFAGNNVNKEPKEASELTRVNQEGEIRTRERSFTDASTRERVLLPPAQIKSRSKPPSLKLATNPESASNFRSPTLSSRPSLTSLAAPLSPTKSLGQSATPTATPTISSPIVSSPTSAVLTPISPVTGSFASTRLSVSTSMTTTSTNTASPLMPDTPILSDAPLTTPILKSAVSVPVLSPTWEGPGFIRRDNSFGRSTGSSYYTDSSPTSPTKGYDDDDDDFEDDAEYCAREFGLTHKSILEEEERKARLSLITDMLDRDLKTTPHQKEDGADVEEPVEQDIFYKPKGTTVRIDETEAASEISRRSPTHFRKSSSASRTSSMIQRRSASGPTSPISPTTPPPVPSKSGFRNLAARMGISNSTSTPQSPPRSENDFDAKRKSIASLMSNGKRRGPKRRLVISGVGDGQGEIDALRDWCTSLGEVRSMVKVKSAEGEVTQIGQGEGCRHNVWVVDFKKSSVAESVCRLQAKVEIKGAGSVRLSWETARPKLSFGMGRKGWIP